jgi:hypothetical protein
MNCNIIRQVADPIPDEIIGFFTLPNSSSRTMALGSTQPLTEMRTRNLLGGKRRPTREADSLTDSQVHGSPRLVTGIALPFYFDTPDGDCCTCLLTAGSPLALIVVPLVSSSFMTVQLYYIISVVFPPSSALMR